jgi:hypothetical protein
MSTLGGGGGGGPNQNYFSHNTLPNNNNNNNTNMNSNNTQHTLNRTSKTNMDNSALGGPQYYQNNASTTSYQSQTQTYQPPSTLTSPYTESLLGVMNREFGLNSAQSQSYAYKQQQQQQYDANITMCQPVAGGGVGVGKLGAAKAMFAAQQQQQFIMGPGGLRAKTDNNVFGYSNNLRNSGTYSQTNYSTNTGKMLKASKI